MTFKPWIPPAGEVVDPPVHPMTQVDVLFSDRSEDANRFAGCLNWSGEGDGPKIIAYSVVEEYVEKRKPREWWINLPQGDFDPRMVFLHQSYEDADWGRRNSYGENINNKAIIHVREVLPEPPLDLTKITTPFGLLDEATQAALKAHGGPYEFWAGSSGWRDIDNPTWSQINAYRVAPSAAPAKPAPREVVAWAVVDDDGSVANVWQDRTNALEIAGSYGGTVVKLTGYL